MSGTHDRCENIADSVIERNVRREDRGLAKLRLSQLLFRSGLLQFKQIVAQHLGGTIEVFTGRRRLHRDVVTHAHDLRTLSGEHHRDSFG